MGTLMIEEEYWTVQYLTQVLGRGEIFWPLDGEGHFGTEGDATERATELLDRYPLTRVVHVVRTMRYATPLAAENPDGARA